MLDVRGTKRLKFIEAEMSEREQKQKVGIDNAMVLDIRIVVTSNGHTKVYGFPDDFYAAMQVMEHALTVVADYFRKKGPGKNQEKEKARILLVGGN
uniref:Uncharacterized protein n=1 Tax=viral metagenome TaxID=1070528 RepID=A0A6M3IKY3_9ZZZZ